MAKAASITAGLVTKKGEAAPSVGIRDSGVMSTKQTMGKVVHDYYKALTVKLDRPRYEALKNAGVKLDKKVRKSWWKLSIFGCGNKQVAIVK